MQKTVENYYHSQDDHYADQDDCKIKTGMLNQLLRDQLTPSPPQKLRSPSESDKLPISLTSAAVDVVAMILNENWSERAELHEKLSELYHLQKAVYDELEINPMLRKRQYISQAGLILSPDNCITTQLDDLRVNAYIRGIDQALTQMFTQNKTRKIHIVYPACGPFAPLLMPLISYYQKTHQFSSKQLSITLIDIQPGAVHTLRALVNELNIQDYVQDIICADALTYHSPNNSIDMVVLEAMQHGFSREGHFSLTRHFTKMLADDGCLIPEKVTVSASLNNAQREFVDQWQGKQCVSHSDINQKIIDERVVLGDILSLTAHSFSVLSERIIDENTTLMECGQVSIPKMSAVNGEQTLLLSTHIHVFGDEKLNEYDSGITHPLPEQQVCINYTPKQHREGDLLLKSGDGIKFYYRLNGLPGFLATWCDGDPEQKTEVGYDE